MDSIARKEETRLARPLTVLSPLIEQEIAAGEEAGLDHYRAAGEMLLEARSQVARGGWVRWYEEQKFRWTLKTATRYMALAEVAASPPTWPNGRSTKTMTDVIGPSQAPRITEPAYHHDVQETVRSVNAERLAQEYKNRQQEDQLVLDLCRKIIKIGFQVLAKELHPDKGGSDEAQARLNKAHARLKEMLSR